MPTSKRSLTSGELRTDRLLLRRWRDSDKDAFAALNADPDVMEHFPAPLTNDESDSLADRASRHVEDEGWGLWAVEIRETKEFIRFTGLEVPSFQAHLTPAVEVAGDCAGQPGDMAMLPRR